MKPKVISISNIKKNTFGHVVFQELLKEHESPDISIATIKLNESNDKQRNNGSDTFYFVLEGSGSFTIEDTMYKVSQGSLIVVLKGSWYFDEGNLTMIAICSPRFDPDQIEIAK